MEEIKNEELAEVTTEEVNEAIEKAVDANEEVRAKAEAYQTERMEKIVIFAREILMPILSRKDLPIEKTKILLENLAVTIQQGLHTLMSKTSVKELGIKELLLEAKEKHPNSGVEDFIEVIEACESATMQDSVESLQWLAQKIDAEVKALTKDKPFTEIVKEF